MLHVKQMEWRCRRGVRELDVLLVRFLDTEYPLLEPLQQLAFQRLLDEQDPQIMDWLFGRANSKDPELQQIIQMLRRSSGLEA